MCLPHVCDAVADFDTMIGVSALVRQIYEKLKSVVVLVFVDAYVQTAVDPTAEDCVFSLPSGE